MVTACHNCTRGPGAACITCKRIDQDDIRIKREPKNVNPELGEATYTPDPAAAIDGGDDARQGATTLPADDEDTLRRFLATVTGLDALAFLAALHFARRGRSRNLAQAVRDFAADVRAYNASARGMSRATIWAKWESLVAKIPALAVLRSWAKREAGSGKADAE
jgi:hypothetical protein